MRLQKRIASVAATPLRLLLWATVIMAGVAEAQSSPQATSQNDVDLQIGVVQRFGAKPADTLVLQAEPGDTLTLRFQTNGQEKTVTSSTIKLDVVMEALPESKVEERVVLSSHRSFESAEASANQWRDLGIATEIAQPERWQVWAKRDVYTTPLLRRLLLQSIRSQGNSLAYLDTKVLSQQPRASFIANNFRYTRDFLEVTAGRRMIQVGQGGAEEDRNRRFYAGSLRLQPNAYGNYTLVNQVPLETYLRGVVPHEIGTSAAPAVLEVQAILARTYALRNLRRFAIDQYQLCATTQCQVYNGLMGTAPSTDRAIAASRGLVLTYENELVDAVYSSSTGGVTAAFGDVWQGPERPYLRTVLDSVNNQWDFASKSLADEKNLRSFISQKAGFNEASEELFRWRVESNLESLNQELRKFLDRTKNPFSFNTIQRLEVTQRSVGGRVLKLSVITDRGRLELEKDEVLIAFDAPNSTLFYLEPVLDENKALRGYAFVGGGFGHGVGLSQTGSYHLGRLGWTSDRILSFYYPGTQLQPLNPKITFWQEPKR
ncbi:MAG TPA: SpoIID/LytB domain-containing protein [Thermosynechococcaceae cyanobacterium]